MVSEKDNLFFLVYQYKFYCKSRALCDNDIFKVCDGLDAGFKI
jgi:hypothetical protein